MLDKLKYHYYVCLQFPRVKDTSFTGVTVEECKILLSGMDPQLFTLTLLNTLETHFPNSLHFFF